MPLPFTTPLPLPEHPYAQPTEWARSFYRQGRLALLLTRLFAKLDLPEDIELPADDRPVLFAGNHRSFFDVFIAYAVFAKLKLSCRILVRADLFKKPLVGTWLRRTGCIPMSSSVREEAERTAIATLGGGHTVAIMPEGRLVPADERPSGVGPAKPGVSRLAEATGASVITVAFHGTDKVWPRGVPIPIPRFRRPTVTLWLGKPMDLPHNDHTANAEYVLDDIRRMLDGIDAGETRPAIPAPARTAS